MVGVNVSHDVLATWCMRSFVDYNAIPNAKRDMEGTVIIRPPRELWLTLLGTLVLAPASTS